jgi:hypothetical protein
MKATGQTAGDIPAPQMRLPRFMNGDDAPQGGRKHRLLDFARGVARRGYGHMGFSNSEALAILKWMVRTRLLETMYEVEPMKAFDAKIKDDFAELMEAGVVTTAEVSQDEEGTVSVWLHRDGDSFTFRAAVIDGRIEIERRAACI